MVVHGSGTERAVLRCASFPCMEPQPVFGSKEEARDVVLVERSIEEEEGNALFVVRVGSFMVDATLLVLEWSTACEEIGGGGVEIKALKGREGE